MLHQVTTGPDDRRPAKPADLVALVSGMTTAEARRWIDAASRKAAGPEGLRFEPWRQTWSSSLEGSDLGYLTAHAKPIESVSSVTDSAGTAYTDYTLGSNGLGVPDRLERDDGWGKSYQTGLGISLVAWAESEKPEWTIAWVLGWLMPGQVSAWVASTAYKISPASTSYDDPATGNAYAVGAWVRSQNASIGLRFECTTAGTTAASEPAEFTDPATAAADEITDGTVTWTARAARELPEDLSEAVLNLAFSFYLARNRDDAVASEKIQFHELRYRQDAGAALEAVRAWR